MGISPAPFRPSAGLKGAAAFSSASLPVDKVRHPCCYNRRRAKSAPSVRKDRSTGHRRTSPLHQPPVPPAQLPF
ncbi:MAG: hypothetical protein E6Z06_07555 [Clostridiales bacterium]|nr:hypothetical protein [Clostridiales bacterium]